MIILPDRNIPRARFLLPVPRASWQFSQALPKDEFGNDGITIRFRVRAKTHDGCVVWCGWFEDRDDFDAFLFALVSGSLRYERELWRLPTPEWFPGLEDGLVYDFLTQTILTTTGSNQTYTSPLDWDNNSNQIECLGAGASGSATRNGATHNCGGGGGAYSRITNFTFATPGTTTATYRVGLGGVLTNPSNGQSLGGNPGEDTWWNDTVMPAAGTSNAKCAAKGGDGGEGGEGGAGGAAASGFGQTRYSGGNGGDLTGSSGSGASGGGGAAGPSGNGGNGGSSSSTAASVRTDGGSSNNGTLAGGVHQGLGLGGDGANGTEFSGSFGCGSGGGGSARATAYNMTGGNGGNYGGGGGGSQTGADFNSDGGAGRQGLIVVEYEPFIPFPSGNMPMLGM